MKTSTKIFACTLTSISLLANVAFADAQKDKAFGFSKDLLKHGINNTILKNIKRTEIEWDVSSKGKPEYSILTVQPIYQTYSKKHTFFTQARAAYGNNGRTTTNFGLGYRNLALDDKLLLGFNTFHDYEFPYNHQRISHGIEIRSSAVEFNSNYYNAISHKHHVGPIANGITERALDGYDMELGMQLPYLPWARLFAKKFYYDGVVNDNDTNGETYTLRLRPHHMLEIEAGHVEDDANPTSEFIQARVRIGWGNQDKNMPLIDNKAFRLGESMKDRTLTKVRRSNTIKVERSSGNGKVSISMQRAN